MTKQIVYVQYTNPAGYPPLEHSSLILARRGWQVLFLGVGSQGTRSFTFPPHAAVKVRLRPAVPPGWKQKLHYVWFCLWACGVILWERPAWVYGSDLMASPVVWFCQLLGFRAIYHEHDAPGAASLQGTVGRWLAAARRGTAQAADLAVIPNEERGRVFRAELQPRRLQLVWNCPRREEARPNRGSDGVIRLLYHGSINAARLPLAVGEALLRLPEHVRLRIGGYETIGSRGYVERFRQHAVAQGVAANRIEVMPTVPTREELMNLCAEAQIGLALMPKDSDDLNMTAMFGASNKVFDYMACGLALVVSDQPDWAGPLVASGTAVACNPEDPGSIAAAVQALIQDPEQLRLRGERGRQLVLDRWNYETQFQPVLETLEKIA